MNKINATPSMNTVLPELISALNTIYKTIILDNYNSKENLSILFDRIDSIEYFADRLVTPSDTSKVYNLKDLTQVVIVKDEYEFTKQDSKEFILDNHPSAIELQGILDPDDIYENIAMSLPDSPSPKEELVQIFLALRLERGDIHIEFNSYPIGKTLTSNNINTINNNNFGFSWSYKRNMYIGGIKSNDTGYFISGKASLLSLQKICEACKIDKLFIDDAAWVNCNFLKDFDSKDEFIKIENFSLARILTGNKGYYESNLSGDYTESEKAKQAKEFLLNEFTPTLSNTEKRVLHDYVKCSKEPCIDISYKDCIILNKIIDKAKQELIKHKFVTPDNEIVFFHYITNFNKKGGKRKTTNKKQKKRKTKKLRN